MPEGSAPPPQDDGQDPQVLDSPETHLRLAVEASGIGVWSWNMATDEVAWSSSMYELFNVPVGTPVTMETFLARVHPEDLPKVNRGMDGSSPRTNGRDVPYEYRIVPRDGDVVWLAARGRVIVDDSRQAQVMHGVVFDITHQKTAQMREREQRQAAETVNERLKFLAEASHILSSSLDYEETLRGVARLAVPTLSDWCGVDLLTDEGRLERVAVEHQDPEKVLLAKRLNEEYPSDPESPTGAYQVVRTGEPMSYSDITDELLKQGAQNEEHLELLRKVGFNSVLIVPLISRGETLGTLILVQSESGRKHSEADVLTAMQLAERAALAVDNARLYRASQQSKEELEQRVAQRTVSLERLNEEMESFMYSASHDLRAPLRGIEGFAQALLDEYGHALDSPGKTYLERVRSAATRMEGIIESLLALSRVSRSDLEIRTVDLSAKVQKNAETLAAEEPDRKAEFNIQRNVSAKGDASMLSIAIDNLLRNAWKFTKNCDSARIEFGSVIHEGQTTYYIRDNGVGFDMQYADKLFQPFQRLHRPQEFDGLGVGLATAQRVIQRHDGRIWAEGDPGKGATFYFTLGDT